jgi:hypothetical protein
MALGKFVESQMEPGDLISIIGVSTGIGAPKHSVPINVSYYRESIDYASFYPSTTHAIEAVLVFDLR